MQRSEALCTNTAWRRRVYSTESIAKLCGNEQYKRGFSRCYCCKRCGWACVLPASPYAAGPLVPYPHLDAVAAGPSASKVLTATAAAPQCQRLNASAHEGGRVRGTFLGEASRKGAVRPLDQRCSVVIKAPVFLFTALKQKGGVLLA